MSTSTLMCRCSPRMLWSFVKMFINRQGCEAPENCRTLTSQSNGTIKYSISESCRPKEAWAHQNCPCLPESRISYSHSLKLPHSTFSAVRWTRVGVPRKSGGPACHAFGSSLLFSSMLVRWQVLQQPYTVTIFINSMYLDVWTCSRDNSKTLLLRIVIQHRDL